MKTIISLLLILASVYPVAAEVYKWTDANGTIHFESSPQPDATNVERKQYDAPAILPGISMRPSADSGKKGTEFDKNKLPVTSANKEQFSSISSPPKETYGDYIKSASVIPHNDSVTISGRIEGGAPCKNLVVKAFAAHPSGRRASIIANAGSIGNGVRSTTFSADDKLYGDIPQSGWFMTNTFVSCGH